MDALTVSQRRSPWHRLPITFALKSMEQKHSQTIHCPFCGLPITVITDRVISVFDATTPVNQLAANESQLEIRCSRTSCKQYYKFEVSL